MTTTVLAVIPARGGSKGVPAKNLAPVAGVPLVSRAIRACLGARLVTDVVVSTDDAAIAAEARSAGAEAIHRPASIAGDTATSESAVLHAMDAFEATSGRRVDVVLLVQCTSPFLTPEEVNGTVEKITTGGADTAFTAAPTHGFLWREAAPAPAGRPEPASDGAQLTAEPTAAEPTAEVTAAEVTATEPTATEPTAEVSAAEPTATDAGTPTVPAAGAYGVNHDKAHRPRRQDREAEYLETGAAYAMAAEGFRTHRHRFFGRTALVVTDPARVLEIDDPHDLARARALAPLLDTPMTPGLDDIDAVVLDFDGTQTDDRVHLDAEGREFVSAHRGDGLGIAALRRAGLPVLILSTEQNAVVAARARKLNIPVLHGIDRKDLALKQWCEEQGIDPQRVLYAGNDVNDLPCFHLVGWPVAVASAHDSVRAAARAVTLTPGGSGAVREIAAWLLGPELHTPNA
ncbi:N-acylneuraminate cytidylyltransferase [Streptomyces vilmorinianum]|uniref:N-acylneuraminate cytidylyltransferase n=1 Tax=Streptomyces vilmorinianum TaxID=3051092 RepID=UPI0010FB1670|nr:N-acylneuraminate cytidylyltransferase [Streptomyces vilmorinianum]